MTRHELLVQLCGLIQSIEELEGTADTTSCICYPAMKGEDNINPATVKYITKVICDELGKRYSKEEIEIAFENFQAVDYGYCKPDPTL